MALDKRYRDEATASNQTSAEAVRTLPAFLQLSASSMASLIALIDVEQVPAGNTLIKEGARQKHLYVFIEGCLQLCARSGTHEATLAILSSPTILNADAVLTDVVSLASIRVLERSRIGRLAINDARRLFKQDRSFADAITYDLSANWRNLLRESKSMRTRNGLQRLVAWILAMLEHADTPHEIKLPYGKGTLAARLGVAAATLSRDLARLAPFGVTVRGRTLTIDDAARLREFTVVDELNTPPVP